MGRIIKGFVIAPLAGILVGALVTSLLFEFSNLGGLGYGVILVFGGLFFAYPFVLFVGVPLFFVLRRFNALSLWLLLVLGALFGTIGWIVASSPVPSPEYYPRAISEGVFGLVSGLVGAAIFWQICVRNNEANPNTAVNKDAPAAARPLP